MAKRSRSQDSRTSKHGSRQSSPAPSSPRSSTTTVDLKKKMEPKPVLPRYLRLSKAEIRRKFEELDGLQRARIEDASTSRQTAHRFALAGSDPEVRARNRYMNVLPWSNHRVKLQVPEDKCDFINASPISVKDSISNEETKYIATQGPKEGQHGHFWHMVFAETKSVAVIVMLTQTVEGGRDKCAQYFPLDMTDSTIELLGPTSEFSDPFLEKERDEMPIGKIELVEMSYNEAARSEVRKLLLTFGDETKVVWHYLFGGWADYSKPMGEDREGLLELIRVTLEKSKSADNPRIVHCSAGVGRTGTFIALDHLLRELKTDALLTNHNSDPRADAVFETVNSLREQRMLMVYNEMQLDFIYEVLKEQMLVKQGIIVKPTANRGEPSPKMARHTLDIDPKPSSDFMVKPELQPMDEHNNSSVTASENGTGSHRSSGTDFNIEGGPSSSIEVPVIVEPKPGGIA